VNRAGTSCWSAHSNRCVGVTCRQRLLGHSRRPTWCGRATVRRAGGISCTPAEGGSCTTVRVWRLLGARCRRRGMGRLVSGTLAISGTSRSVGRMKARTASWPPRSLRRWIGRRCRPVDLLGVFGIDGGPHLSGCLPLRLHGHHVTRDSEADVSGRCHRVQNDAAIGIYFLHVAVSIVAMPVGSAATEARHVSHQVAVLKLKLV